MNDDEKKSRDEKDFREDSNERAGGEEDLKNYLKKLVDEIDSLKKEIKELKEEKGQHERQEDLMPSEENWTKKESFESDWKSPEDLNVEKSDVWEHAKDSLIEGARNIVEKLENMHKKLTSEKDLEEDLRKVREMIEDAMDEAREYIEDLKSLSGFKTRDEFKAFKKELKRLEKMYLRIKTHLRLNERGKNMAKKIEKRTRMTTENLDEEISNFAEGFSYYMNSLMSSIFRSLNETLKNVFVMPKDVMPPIKLAFSTSSKKPGFVFKFSDDMGLKYFPRAFEIPEEYLEDFYVKGAELMDVISDPTRLKMLKILEAGPQYQSTLSDLTKKGGAFKHHVNLLINAGLVTQEDPRGKYMITVKGRKILKFVEFLYLMQYHPELFRKRSRRSLQHPRKLKKIKLEDQDEMNENTSFHDEESESVEGVEQEKGDEKDITEDEHQIEFESREDKRETEDI